MAVEDDLIRKNPFDFELAEVLINNSVSRNALTAKQERDFLKFVKEDEHFSKYYNGMYILFKTGLRISELCGLTIKDIDLKERTISIDHQLQYTGGRGAYIEKTKTENGVRVLPMSDDVYEAMKKVISGRKKPKIEHMIDGYGGFLFLDDRGKPMMSYQWEKRFQHAVQKYNSIYKVELPKITPHICRHTYCTNMVKRGVSVKTLQYLMGHADINTTLGIYTHLKLDDAKNELEQLEVRESIQQEIAKRGMEDARKELSRVRSI
jgi:integrase